MKAAVPSAPGAVGVRVWGGYVTVTEAKQRVTGAGGRSCCQAAYPHTSRWLVARTGRQQEAKRPAQFSDDEDFTDDAVGVMLVHFRSIYFIATS